MLHWPALQELRDRYQVVAVANRSRAKGEDFAKLVGLEANAVYTDYRGLLSRGDLDVVDLVLPPQFNLEVARAAAESGIHVICEKPIAVSPHEALDMISLTPTFGIQVLVAENFRYDNAVRKARALINEGRILPPFMFSYHWMQAVPLDDEIAARPWRQTPALAGGMLSDHGVHMVDVARFLMGEVTSVQAHALDLRDDLGGSDAAVINMQFESGSVGSIQWSFAVASEQMTRILLWSEDGVLDVTPDTVRLQRQGMAEEVFPIVGLSSFVNEFKDFYAALVDGTELQMTSQDALQDLRVVLGAHQSSLTNEVVLLNREHQP
jgi:predicted dehydrogenase